ncbi:TPA: elongation factor 1-beta [Candidatus Bathyarchaeota archaeon]|nr:elongation factor 1-beta [Candidatus Bathyarchaeota archaeon]
MRLRWALKGGNGALARVLTSIKIFPSSPEVDLASLRKEVEEKLPSGAAVLKFEEEPIAFGLVALIAHVAVPETMPEKIDEVERALKSLEGVGENQVVRSTRI